MQMFEYESLYNTKMFCKTFHLRRWEYLQQVHHTPKVKGEQPPPPPPPPKKKKKKIYFSILNKLIKNKKN